VSEIATPKQESKLTVYKATSKTEPIIAADVQDLQATLQKEKAAATSALLQVAVQPNAKQLSPFAVTANNIETRLNTTLSLANILQAEGLEPVNDSDIDAFFLRVTVLLLHCSTIVNEFKGDERCDSCRATGSKEAVFKSCTHAKRTLRTRFKTGESCIPCSYGHMKCSHAPQETGKLMKCTRTGLLVLTSF